MRHCAARKLATKMIRLLCELMKTFDDVPDERYLTMRLTYHKHTVRCTLPSPTTSTRYAALFPHPHSAHPRASCSLVCSALAASLRRKFGIFRRRSSGG